MSEEADLATTLGVIEAGNENYPDDERTIIDSWVSKLREPTADEKARNNVLQYADALAKLVTEKKRLSAPFHDLPPQSLPPFSDQTTLQAKKQSSQSKRQSFQIKRMPCNRLSTHQESPPKPKKPDRKQPSVDLDLPAYNQFEDPEEMARAIARSKGQTFAEFVASVSRHTKDFGRELRAAMKAETSGFREYVDHVLSQRIKDLTEVLDEEQNRELLRIKKDTDKWQMELSHVKRRIKEVVPAFDIDLYRKDKNFLKKQFSIGSPALPQDDSFQRWQEENCHRLRWMTERTNKISSCNEKITQEISIMKSETLELEAKEAIKQQEKIKFIKCEIAKFQRLKQERDRLHKENAELLSQLQEN